MRKSVLDEAMNFEDNKEFYTEEENKKIRKSLRIKIAKKMAKLSKSVVDGIGDINYL